MAESRKRLRYIDFYKALSIILVVLAHINFANLGLKPWINGFVIPAFFFASGLLLKSDQGFSFGDSAQFIWKRFQALMIPYFLWAMLFSALSLQNLVKIAYGSHVMLLSAGSLSSLWFLPTLFLSLLYFAVVRMTLKKHFLFPVKLAMIAVAFAVSFLLPSMSKGYPWCFDVSFSAFGFLLLGNTVLPMIKAFHERCSDGKMGAAVCGLVLLLSFAGTMIYRLNLPFVGNHVMVAEARYGNPLLFLLTAMFGIVFTMAAAVLLDLLLPLVGSAPRAITYIGENTMALFVVQKPVIAVFRKAFDFIPLPSAVALIVTCFGTTLICCLIAMLLNHYIPISVGRVPPIGNTMIMKPGKD